jgi:hypothetical protein
MTCDKQNIQRIIVIIQSSEGTILVNPLALLAKELEAVPRPIAKIKIKYGSRVFIIGCSYLRGIFHLLIKPRRLIRLLHPSYHLPTRDHNTDDTRLPLPETLASASLFER